MEGQMEAQKTYEFVTEGMSCGNCVKHVTKAIQGVDPQADVQIDLTQQMVRVKSAQASKTLESAMEEAGYPVLESKQG